MEIFCIFICYKNISVFQINVPWNIFQPRNKDKIRVNIENFSNNFFALEINKVKFMQVFKNIYNDFVKLKIKKCYVKILIHIN